MLDELLGQWAALEPERCWRNSGKRFLIHEPFLIHNPAPGDQFWWAVYLEADSLSLAKLQASVQATIVARELLYTLENTQPPIHHAVVMSPSPGRSASGDDIDPAVALLKAYVAWLAIAQKGEVVTGGNHA